MASLELPRLPQDTPQSFQIWWQQLVEALEAAYSAQEEASTALEEQAATLAQTVADLQTAQTNIETAQADITTALSQIGAVEGTTTTLADSIAILNAVLDAGTFDATGIDLVSGAVYKIAGTQVVGPQQGAVANAVNAAAVPTQAEFNAFVTQFNALLAHMRTHGLIAT